ncbi:MAG: hypothetical protein JSV13_08070 [Nitrospiraceae bacterium]|nr:MAG: hypothetical protein JSV13_08070 [Nitrospiraceae bacterium]
MSEKTRAVRGAVEVAISTPKGKGVSRRISAAYLATFIAGCILFPEATAGLTLGFLFLDIGLRYPESLQ